MPGLSLNKVHIYGKTQDEMGNTVVRLIRSNPYTRISAQDQPPIFVQGGRYFSDEGTEEFDYHDLPEWFWDEARKITPKVRQECGLILPEERTEVSSPQVAEVYEFPTGKKQQVKKKIKLKKNTKSKTASGFKRKNW